VNQGNWDHTIGSNKATIYLTCAYPLHFAFCATDPDGDDQGVILEVDATKLNQHFWCADEDALEQIGRGNDSLPATWDMKQRTLWYRERAHEYPGNVSLELLGTIGYRGVIPFDAVTRYVTIENEAMVRLCALKLDPMISINNYRYVGKLYRDSVRWLFGDIAEVRHPRIPTDAVLPPEFNQPVLSAEDYDGIKVIEVKDSNSGRQHRQKVSARK
jgi:hypothetical protein